MKTEMDCNCDDDCDDTNITFDPLPKKLLVMVSIKIVMVDQDQMIELWVSCALNTNREVRCWGDDDYEISSYWPEGALALLNLDIILLYLG